MSYTCEIGRKDGEFFDRGVFFHHRDLLSCSFRADKERQSNNKIPRVFASSVRIYCNNCRRDLFTFVY
jgi:hypothetical protein